MSLATDAYVTQACNLHYGTNQLYAQYDVNSY